MIRFAVLLSGLALSAFAHAQGMKGMDMKDMHKDMPMQGMQHDSMGQAAVHEASGTVTKVMAFGVKDKALLENLQPGRKIEFQFAQQGEDYVITGVK